MIGQRLVLSVPLYRLLAECSPLFSTSLQNTVVLLILSILPVVLHCTHRELTSLMTKSEGLHGSIVYDRNPEAEDSADDDD